MSNATLKKLFLAGTALVAVSALPARAMADVALTAAQNWGADASGSGGVNLSGTGSGEAVDLGGFALTVLNDGVNDDGSGDTNHFMLGAVTDSEGGGALTIKGFEGQPLTLDVASVADGVNVSITGNSPADHTGIDVTFGNAELGTLVINQNDTGTVHDLNAAFTGDFSATSASIVTNEADAAVSFAGGAIDFGTGLTLDDGTLGAATVTFNGSAAQTVDGAINGAAAGEGTLVVDNAAADTIADPVTFNGNLGAAHALKAFDVVDGQARILGTLAAKETHIGDNGALSVLNDGSTQLGLLKSDVVFDGAGGQLNLGGSLLADGTTGASGAIDFNDFDATVNIAGSADAQNPLVIAGDIDDGSSGGAKGTVDAVGGNIEFQGNVGVTQGIASILIENDAQAHFKGTVQGLLTVDANVTTAAVTLDKGITGNVQIDGDGEVQVGDGAQIDGAVSLSDTNIGTLTFLGDGVYSNNGTPANANDDTYYAATGRVGSGNAGNYLKKLSAGADGKTVQFADEVDAKTVEVSGTGTVVFDGAIDTGGGVLTFADAGTAKLKGALVGDIDFAGIDGTVEANAAVNGNVYSTGDKGMLKIMQALTVTGDISNLKELRLADNLTVAGSVSAKTLALDVNTLTITTPDGYTLSSGQTLSLKFDGAGSDLQGSLAARIKTTDSGATIALSSGTVNISAAGMQAGDEILLADAVNALDLSDFTATLISSNGLRYSYALENGDVYIHSTVADTTSNEGKVWQVIADGASATTPDPDILALNNAINNAGSDAERNALLQSALPSVGTRWASVQSAIDTSEAVSNILAERLAMARTGADDTGVAAGTAADGYALWAQAYGQHAKQDMKEGVPGYSANTFGGAFGFDTANLLPFGTVGLAVNYGRTGADGKDSTTTALDVDSYGLTLYGTEDLAAAFFVEGQASYAYNKINSERHNVGGATASGDTHSDQLGARLALGRNFRGPGGMTLTPRLSADYTNLEMTGYTESGAGGLNLTLQDDNYHAAHVGADVKLGWDLKQDGTGARLKPTLHGGYSYSLNSDPLEDVATFAGGGSFIATGAKPEHSTVNGGAGLTYATTEGWDISADYNYTWRSSYDASSGTLRVTSRF